MAESKTKKVTVDTRKPRRKTTAKTTKKPPAKKTPIKKMPYKKPPAKKPVTKPAVDSENIDLDGPGIIEENNTLKKTEENLENNFSEKENNIPINSENLDNQPIAGLGNFLEKPMIGSEKIEEKKDQINPTENPSINSEIKNEKLDHGESFRPKFNPENDGFSDSENIDLDSEDFGNSDDPEDMLFDSMISDHKLMAEFLIEGIDLVAVSGASFLAKDFSNYEKYDSLIPETKKNKLKKPLEAILQQRQAKADPMVVFIGMIIIIYAPVYMKALEDRKLNKMTIEQKAKVMETKPPAKKRRGRPKGSTKKTTAK